MIGVYMRVGSLVCGQYLHRNRRDRQIDSDHRFSRHTHIHSIQLALLLLRRRCARNEASLRGRRSNYSEFIIGFITSFLVSSLHDCSHRSIIVLFTSFHKISYISQWQQHFIALCDNYAVESKNVSRIRATWSGVYLTYLSRFFVKPVLRYLSTRDRVAEIVKDHAITLTCCRRFGKPAR